MKITTNCAQCGASFECERGAANRAAKRGAPLYCGRICSGLGRRKHLDKDVLVERKRLYDMEYRRRNRDLLKAKKAAYFRATYDPQKAAIDRKARMSRHVEYCRRPEYRAYKAAYDRQYRAREYGEFADAFNLLLDLEGEVLSRMTRYEIGLANGTINKALKRRREYESTFRVKPEGSPLGHAQPNQGRQDSGEPG